MALVSSKYTCSRIKHFPFKDYRVQKTTFLFPQNDYLLNVMNQCDRYIVSTLSLAN